MPGNRYAERPEDPPIHSEFQDYTGLKFLERMRDGLNVHPPVCGTLNYCL